MTPKEIYQKLYCRVPSSRGMLIDEKGRVVMRTSMSIQRIAWENGRVVFKAGLQPCWAVLTLFALLCFYIMPGVIFGMCMSAHSRRVQQEIKTMLI